MGDVYAGEPQLQLFDGHDSLGAFWTGSVPLLLAGSVVGDVYAGEPRLQFFDLLGCATACRKATGQSMSSCLLDRLCPFRLASSLFVELKKIRK